MRVVNVPAFDPQMGITWIGTDGSIWDLRHGAVVRLTTVGLRGITMPELDHQITESAYTDGQRLESYKLKARSVFLPLRFVGGAPQATQREFWRSMTPGRYGTLRVDDGLGGIRSIALRFSDDGARALRIDPNVMSDLFGVTMMADDPWYKGQPITQDLAMVYGEDLRSMFGQVEGDAPLNITSSYTKDYTEFVNPGDVRAYPVWRITATADEGVTTYQLYVDGNLISGSTDIAVGQTLTIDTDPRALSAQLTGPDVDPADADRTGDLDSIGFAPIEPGGTARVKVVVGASSYARATIVPLYFMGI